MERKMIHQGKLAVTSVLCFATSIASATPAVADSYYEQGVAAYDQGKYSTAFGLIKESAEQGVGQAQHLLATFYRRGIGVSANEYEGFSWCQRAAEQGVLEAQFQLGLMFLEGEGVTEDEEKAVEWLWAAADRGYPQATELLQYVLTHDTGYGC